MDESSLKKRSLGKKKQEIVYYTPNVGSFQRRCNSEQSNKPLSSKQDSKLHCEQKYQSNNCVDSEKYASHKNISSCKNSFPLNKTSNKWDSLENASKVTIKKDYIILKKQDFSETIEPSLCITFKNDSGLEKDLKEVAVANSEEEFLPSDKNYANKFSHRSVESKNDYLIDGKPNFCCTINNCKDNVTEVANVHEAAYETTNGDKWNETFSDIKKINEEVQQNSSSVSASCNDQENTLAEISTVQQNVESLSASYDCIKDYCTVLYKCKITDLAASTLGNNLLSFIPPPQPKPITNAEICRTEVAGEGHLNSSTFPNLSIDNIACRSVSSPEELDLKGTVDIKIPAHVPDDKQFQEITKYIQNIVDEKSMASDIADCVVKDVNRVLAYRMKGNRVFAYGSFRIGTAITTSNLNLALQTDQPIKNNFLLHLQKMLSKDLTDYQVYPFEEEQNARRSKIYFSQNELGINCEIIYLGETVSQYLKLSNILRSVCKYDDRIKILCIAVKRWAEIGEIQDPENGMLRPIGLTLIVIHFLQQMEEPLLPLINISSENWGLSELPFKNNASVGELWINFLKYYSCTFNWRENVVSVTNKNTLPKSSKSWNVSWIGIEDPISEKNVADSVITSDKVESIISYFKSTYEYFMSPLSDSDSCSESDSQNSGKYSFSDCVLNPPCAFSSDWEDDSENENYEPQRVVLEPLKEISKFSLECVNHVLIEAYNEFKIPEFKVKERKGFVKILQGELKKLYPGVELSLFGSSVNGFGFKNSDLDICMTFKDKDKMDMCQHTVLKRVLRELRRNKSYKNVVPVYSAQVPIIKFHYIIKNWNCDLSFYNVLAVHNSILLCKYSLMDERCKILGCCLKLLAKKANIADSASRALSSYSYIIMVIHYLQQVNPPVLPVLPIHDKEVFEKRIDVPEVLKNCNYWHFENVAELNKRYRLNEKNTLSVGELWLGLLEYYLTFDFDKVVTITQKDPMFISTLMRSARFINIEDPFLSKRNLGCIVSENKAETSRRILLRSRMLFGKDYPYKSKANIQGYYFSPSNLTGQYLKDVECLSCGNFGHEKTDCTKANPFKRKQFINRTFQTFVKTKWDD